MNEVSIIIPVYNREKLVPAAIESVLAQTHNNIVAVAVNSNVVVVHSKLFAFGIAGGGGILELFVDYEDRSWTILITQTNGISCIGASGRDFEFTFATAKGDKS